MRVCDNCKEPLIQGTAVKVLFGYPSVFDGKELEFCTDRCAVVWLSKHWLPAYKKRKGIK